MLKKNLKLWIGLSIGLIVWIIVVQLRKVGVVIPIISNHLTDFYSVPMYCLVTQLMMNFIFKNDKNYINLKLIITSAINLSLTFELLLPKISDKFTADIYDVISYFVGGILFYFILEIRRKKLIIKNPS